MGIRRLWPVVTKAIKPTRGRILTGLNQVFLVGNVPQAIDGIHRLLTSRFAHVQANVEIYGRAVSKARHGRCERQLWQAYSLTFADRRSIETGLRALGWTVFLADGEADLAIEQRSFMVSSLNPAIESVVVSSDSDFLVYPNMRAVYRPTSQQEFLFYDVAECWDELGLSRAKLTALGIVCHNDYSENIHGFGVATNLSIIKSLDEGRSC
jgi:hypothetical protein